VENVSARAKEPPKIPAWHLTAARARAANFQLSPVESTIPAVEAGDGDLISLSGEWKYITASRVREKFLDRNATAPQHSVGYHLS
jgi:hypothetical protein